MKSTLKFLIAAGAILAVAACSEEPASPEAAAANSGGSTAAAVDQSTLQYFQQTVGDSVFFATNASSISPRARQTLQRQAQWLNANLAVNAQIAGHADERGTREFNLALGARRAESVRSFLVSQGVAAGRLSTISYGKERPAAPCSAETCWSQNRRGVTGLVGAPTS
ncbi:MAG: peptidoglycan-associated lipoprotein Pal [Paracoccaceae bacterium]|jgi:peptidoglycan-associated lipoprotein|nr:peptidoglycan-associated lipoprotein Pal [Paracoccaceae bacterium]MDG1371914.1 peptidoglycan-associated lipoprotein Pal [Paracoccaceae bacterium]MDG1971032.1 peptidoglycan-associated lipoprotein Pal [Paracoccaceae bacterium]